MLAIGVLSVDPPRGQVRQDALLGMIKAETLDEEQMAMVIAGMQNLVSALTEAAGDANGTDEKARHCVRRIRKL